MSRPVSPALFDQFARGWRGYALIALIAMASSLFGATRVQVMDPDEASFAQATRQMIDGADYAEGDALGAHWLQVASVIAAQPFTHKLNIIWPYRLASALGIALASLATLWAGQALLGPRSAFLGAGMFAAGAFVGFQGMTATPAAVALGFTTLALAALAHLRFSATRTRLDTALFWAAVSCGAMADGVVTPLVAALALVAIAAWERRTAWMKPLLWWPALLPAAALVTPWMLAVVHGDAIAPHTPDSHGTAFALPGYHTFLLAFLIFPATYALPAAARLCWEAIRAPRADESYAPMRFLLCWALPVMAVLELAPAKLPQDALPAYPAFALLCGAGLLAMGRRAWRSAHPAGVVFFGVVGVLIVVLMAGSATLMPGDFAADLRRAISTGLVGVGVVAAAVTALIMLRRPSARAGAMILCALILSFSLRERLLPEARALNVSSEAVAALTRARLTPRADRPLWVVGYAEPSLVFLNRAPIRLATTEDAGAQAAIGDALMIEGRALQEVSARLALRGLVFTPSEPPVRGLALARGERVTLFVGTLAPTDATGARQQAP